MRHRLRVGSAESGSVTAEFATAMPAVVVVLAICLGAGQVVSRQLSLQDAATAAARSISRGEPASAVDQRIGSIAPGGSAIRNSRDGLACVTVSAPASFGPASITLSATGCALQENQW